MARWVPGGRYLVTWWKAPGYLPSVDPFLKFRPALGTATELPCTLCAMLSVLCFFLVCAHFIFLLSLFVQLGQAGIFFLFCQDPHQQPLIFPSSFILSSSLSPSILTCHPCCECLGGSVVGGFLAPKNVGRLQSRSLFEEICFF